MPPGSAAEAAGLDGASFTRDGGIVPGDVITAVDGKAVESAEQLLARLDDYRVGDVVRLSVTRGGERREVEVPLQAGSEGLSQSSGRGRMAIGNSGARNRPQAPECPAFSRALELLLRTRDWRP
ncbi:PDZ domain-containing protein [Azotobacter chroococcum]